jgi:hypothetical protein
MKAGTLFSHSGKSIALRDVERVAAFPESQHKEILDKIGSMDSKEKESFFATKPSPNEQVLGLWLENDVFDRLDRIAASEGISVEKLCSKIILEGVKNWQK